MLKMLKKLAFWFAIGFVPVCACGARATRRHHVRGTLNAGDVADSGVLFSCDDHALDGDLVWYDDDKDDAYGAEL